MMINGTKASSNLRILEIVARKLGILNEQVVYVGGCATALIVNDPRSLDVRQTVDVDCIVEVAAYPGYKRFENELRKAGFTQSQEDDVICRWRCDEIIVDVMPTDDTILGFGNPWYKNGLLGAETHFVFQDLPVKSITAPYFLATKIEAYRGRGNNDLWGSHDFEDIITVVAGRIEIVEEISLSDESLKKHVASFLRELLNNDQFEQILPGHLNDGPATKQRVQSVMSRITEIARLEG